MKLRFLLLLSMYKGISWNGHMSSLHIPLSPSPPLFQQVKDGLFARREALWKIAAQLVTG